MMYKFHKFIRLSQAGKILNGIKLPRHLWEKLKQADEIKAFNSKGSQRK